LIQLLLFARRYTSTKKQMLVYIENRK
jgi:hypothetical protein